MTQKVIERRSEPPVPYMPRVPGQGVGGWAEGLQRRGCWCFQGPGGCCSAPSHITAHSRNSGAALLGGFSAAQTEMAISRRAQVVNFGSECVVLSPPTYRVHGNRGMATSA